MSTPWNWVLDNDWAGHVLQIQVSILFSVTVPLAAVVVCTHAGAAMGRSAVHEQPSWLPRSASTVGSPGR